MELNFINAAGGILVALMLAPNLVYAIRCPGGENKCKNKWMNFLEQIGRYGSMALMILPLGMREFGFSSVAAMLVYLFGNGGLLLAYWVCWIFYFRKPSRKWAMALAVLPTCIFFLSGITLGHWLLVFAAILFGAGHLYVTSENFR